MQVYIVERDSNGHPLGVYADEESAVDAARYWNNQSLRRHYHVVRHELHYGQHVLQDGGNVVFSTRTN